MKLGIKNQNIFDVKIENINFEKIVKFIDKIFLKKFVNIINRYINEFKLKTIYEIKLLF